MRRALISDIKNLQLPHLDLGWPVVCEANQISAARLRLSPKSEPTSCADETALKWLSMCLTLILAGLSLMKLSRLQQHNLPHSICCTDKFAPLSSAPHLDLGWPVAHEAVQVSAVCAALPHAAGAVYAMHQSVIQYTVAIG
jgi:hypothetical protein